VRSRDKRALRQAKEARKHTEWDRVEEEKENNPYPMKSGPPIDPRTPWTLPQTQQTKDPS
jgi:hypothetical protein